MCQRFAAAHLEGWYRYVVTAEVDGIDTDWDTDWDTWTWIISTPAHTPSVWRAKALAFSAWDRASYDDTPEDRDGSSPMLASLLRDMVAPERNVIVARLAAKYGPLPERYTPEGIWLGSATA